MNATMSLEATKHYPVMLDQVLSIISPQHGGTFIDCTFGGGGYSQAILKYPDTKVFAIDRDELTQKNANLLIKKFPKRFNFFRNKFSNLKEIIKINLKPKAIIFDLGLSSLQLDDLQRGFSFKSRDSLNMQMGINEYSAYDVVNTLDKKNLANMIKILGEEKDGRIIANKIAKYRNKKPINTANELADIINEAKKNYNKYKINPATKTFQAIRIFINQELSELAAGLRAATELLGDGGILVVVSFHSLEDKIVKSFFNQYSNRNKNPSRYFPVSKNKLDLFKMFLKKPLLPTNDEVEQNKRSRSAKIRYAIRNNNPFLLSSDTENKFINYFKIEEMKI
jgi:16S rRNA (cytosine1402-N4)-methyltransferase